MTKKNGLGEIAKGLDWIGKEKPTDVMPAATPTQLSSMAVSVESKSIGNVLETNPTTNQDVFEFEQNMPLSIENDSGKYLGDHGTVSALCGRN